jgi:hypothetical protein
VNLNAPASIRRSEQAIVLGVKDGFSKNVFKANQSIFHDNRFRSAPIAEALNRIGSRNFNGKNWTSREVGWLIARLGPVPKRGRRILRATTGK